jgi:anti-sigma factor RsiW
MNINRNNYEQFFLLYADNELSDQEKKIVTMFVQENPDLEEEFLMLQQSVVTPDKDITIGDKSFLLKQENQFICAHNFEEVFVAYHDGELTQTERLEVEKFIADDPLMQKELALFQQLKYEPDLSVVFPGKRSLLKKERRGKVITLNLRRALVAAAFLAFGLWAGVTYLIKQKTPVITVQVTPKSQVISKPAPADQQQATTTNNSLLTTATKTSPVSKIQGKDIRKEVTPRVVQQIAKNNESQKKPVKLNTLVEEPNNEAVIKDPVKINDVAIELPKNTDKVTTEDLKPDIQVNNKAEAETYAQTASYTLDARNDNYVFYNVTQEQFKKTRLFGLLKKVKRVIERKSPFNHNNDKAELAVN